MTPSQALREAALMVAEARLSSSRLAYAYGGPCIIWILHHVARSDAGLFDQVLRLLHHQISTKEFVGGREIVCWYDSCLPDRKAIISELERAAEIGEPEKRRVLIPAEVPALPMTPDSPLWTEPAPEEPKRVPEKVPV